MPKGIEIGIASETKAFKQGVEVGMIAPVEDAAEALEKLGDGKGLDQLEDGFEDAQYASKKLERETRDTADNIERNFRTAYRSMKEDAEGSSDDAAEGMETLQSKSERAAGRIAGSFDGSFQGIAQGAQRLAATAFSGFGPAGVLAGAAAAAGIGLISDAIGAVEESTEKMKERITSAFQSAAEDGRTALDEAQITAAAIDIIFDKDARKKAQDEARAIGIDAQTYIRALAGDQDALTAAIEASAAAEQKHKDLLEGAVGAQGQALSDFNDSVNIATLINNKLETQQTIMNDNAGAASLALAIRSQDHELIQKQNKALADTPKTVPVKVALDTSAIDEVERNPRRITLQVGLTDRYGRSIG